MTTEHYGGVSCALRSLYVVPIFLVSTSGEGENFGFTVWVSINTFTGDRMPTLANNK